MGTTRGHMSEDISKARKRTRRRAKVIFYENVNKPARNRSASLAALRAEDDCDDASGAHAEAEGACESMSKPDLDKGAAEWAQSAQRRASRDNSSNVPDFNSQRNAGYSRRVAVGHPDLNQQPPRFFGDILARLRTNPYNFVGAAAFHNAFSSTDNPAGSPGNNVNVRSFDAAAHAGSYRGAPPVDVSPRAPVTGYHQERGSATAPNGGHSLRDPESHAVSNKSRVDIMRETMRRMDNG